MPSRVTDGLECPQKCGYIHEATSSCDEHLRAFAQRIAFGYFNAPYVSEEWRGIRAALDVLVDDDPRLKLLVRGYLNDLQRPA